MKVLVADDDAVARRVLTKLLGDWGYEVLVVEDGQEAWELLNEPGSPRLVLLDWQMPGLSGIEVCRRLPAISEGPACYVILITSRSDKKDIVEGLDAGASDYLPKPFNVQELRARVQVGRRVVELQADLNVRIRELEDAQSHIKKLQGILPICMFCHRIRSDDETWDRLEKYLDEHSEAELSHGLCPECLEKHYPER